MKNFVLLLVAVLFLGLPGAVRAEELMVEPLAVDEVVEVEVPDVESRWFGLRWAFERVSHSIQMVLANTDEKKDALQMKFAEKELLLMNKIAELEESNPELAEKFAGRLEKTLEKYKERVSKLEAKMSRFTEREQEMKTKMERWMERNEEREHKLEIKKEEINDRVKNRGVDVQEGVEDGESEEELGQTLEGGSVRIQNARSGQVRVR